MSDTIIHTAEGEAQQVAAVPAAVIDHAETIGEHTAAIAGHDAKLAEHELAIGSLRADLDQARAQLDDVASRAYAAASPAEVEALRDDVRNVAVAVEEAAAETVEEVEAVAPAPVSTDAERPTKTFFGSLKSTLKRLL